jgi:DNA polymerase I-like protein with 3'-5' exonuclease and polymerase domains
MTSITEHFLTLGPRFAADTETAMAPLAFQGRDHVRLFQAYNPHHSFWIDLAELSDVEWAELRACLEDPALEIIFQNAAFDLRVLQGCGINIKGKVDDTMLVSWLLNNGMPNVSNSLEAIARRELNLVLDKSLQKQDWMTAELSTDDLAYAMGDVEATWLAFDMMHPRLVEAGLEIAYEVELKAILPTIQMEATGIHMDRAVLDEQVVELTETRDSSLTQFIEELDTELQEYDHEGLPRLEDGTINLNKVTRGSVHLGTKVYAGFNPGSSQQLMTYFNAIDVDPRDPKGKPSVDKKFLAAFRHRPVVNTYLQWKRADKHLQMCATLIKAQQEDGRIYARFNQTGTFTGRYSCVAGHTPLTTSRGTFRFDMYLPQEGDLVLTHLGRWQPVVRKIYKGEDRMFCISTKLGGELTCTADHRLLTPGGWVRVGDLKPGDTVVGFDPVGLEPTEHSGSHRGLQGGGQTNPPGDSGASQHRVPQHLAHLEGAFAAGGVQGRKGVALLTKQDAAEPYAGQEWFPTPQLQRVSAGPQGLSDRAGRQRWADLSASAGDAAGAGLAVATRELACASHRREPAEQRSGQPRSGDTDGAQRVAPQDTEIAEITPLGIMGVWDIEVAGDHSYAAGGFLNHNSSGPNLQNIPRGAMRYAFTAPEGRSIVDLDYSGMELRALCSPRIADEPVMREAFNNGADIHKVTASLMFHIPEEEVTDEQRRQAKAVNFGSAYGSGPGGLVNYFQSIGMTITLAEGEAFLQAWLNAYPNIARWHNQCREWVKAGEPVRMVDGRRRYLMGEAEKHTTMANNIVQGSCASAMKLALAEIYDKLPSIDPTARLVGVIHDEVLIEADTDRAWAVLELAEAAMVEAGKEIFGDSILLEAEGSVGDSWGSAKG